MSGGVSGNNLSPLLSTRRRKLATVAIILIAAVIPFTTTASVTETIFSGLLFVMLGVSWNLLAGYAGQVSLGHAAFFGIGAFVSAWLTDPVAALPAAIQIPGILTLPFAAFAAGFIALVIGPIMFRLSGHYFAIGTLALATIIQLILVDIRALSGGSTGYYIGSDLTLAEPVLYLIALGVTVGLVAVSSWLVNSRYGLGMRAIDGDEEAASTLGVSPLRYKMYAFVISSAMAGLAGGLYAQFYTYVNAESVVAVTWMINTLVVVILGGMGTLIGPVLGAGLFLALDTGLRTFAGGFATTIEGVLIMAFIVFLPTGLYGIFQSRRSDDDEEADPTEAAVQSD